MSEDTPKPESPEAVTKEPGQVVRENLNVTPEGKWKMGSKEAVDAAAATGDVAEVTAQAEKVGWWKTGLDNLRGKNTESAVVPEVASPTAWVKGAVNKEAGTLEVAAEAAAKDAGSASKLLVQKGGVVIGAVAGLDAARLMVLGRTNEEGEKERPVGRILTEGAIAAGTVMGAVKSAAHHVHI